MKEIKKKTMAEAELDSLQNKVVTAVTSSQVQRSVILKNLFIMEEKVR